MFGNPNTCCLLNYANQFFVYLFVSQKLIQHMLLIRKAGFCLWHLRALCGIEWLLSPSKMHTLLSHYHSLELPILNIACYSWLTSIGVTFNMFNMATLTLDSIFYILECCLYYFWLIETQTWFHSCFLIVHHFKVRFSEIFQDCKNLFRLN